VNEPERRPDPDRLLAQLREDEEKERRGALKIFFGASAGVGKTYTMLEDGKKQHAAGRDVVVGYVEPHGRRETEALLIGLPQLLPRAADHGGLRVLEFDVDAALARHPELILVDELAHTNADGSRHAKRWQDVEDLLAAGIDVYTTLNVQHLESLNDIVAQITGVTVRETLPDAVFERAEDVELIDLPPDDLLARLREGRVYLPQLVERALAGFFRRGNLVALRELALRRTADRVNADVLSVRRQQASTGPWPTRERVLVCIGPDRSSARVVRAGRRLATALRADWMAATVQTPFTRRLSETGRRRIAQNLRLAEGLGAETMTLSGQRIADEILSCARARNVTQIVVGAPARPRWLRAIVGSTTDDLIRSGGDIDTHVVPHAPGNEADGSEDEGGAAADAAGHEPPAAHTAHTAHTEDTEDTEHAEDAEHAPPAAHALRDGSVAGSRPAARETSYRAAALVVLACSLVAGLMDWAGLSEANLVMIYLLGVAYVAARHGRGPAVATSIASVLVFDFVFVPPAYTFEVSGTQYLLTFAVMLGIALLISTMTVRIREQAEASREREQRTGALFRMSRHLSSTTGTLTLVHVALIELADVFGKEVTILLPDAAGRLAAPPGAPAGFVESDERTGVALWVLQHGQAAGHGTDTLPGCRALYMPLTASQGTLGVLGIKPPEGVRLSAPEQRQLLQTLANQIALALERDALARTAQQVQVAAETERLRNSLLASVSHDLRTPLAVISGASGALLEEGEPSGVADPAVRRQMLQSIHSEAARLSRLVRNLLDMTRLQSGALAPECEWLPLEEVVGSALNALGGRLSGRAVRVDLPAELPMLFVDGVLLEQVFINLLENALRHTPEGTPIDIHAHAEPAETAAAAKPAPGAVQPAPSAVQAAAMQDVVIDVSDRGPGIPPDELARVFEKFYRSQRGRGGTGLGLTICRGIVEAHGGRMEALARDGGGATFRLRLPVRGRPPALAPEPAREGAHAAHAAHDERDEHAAHDERDEHGAHGARGGDAP